MKRKMKKTRIPGVFKRGERYIVVTRDPAGRQRKKSVRTYEQARRLKSRLDLEKGSHDPQVAPDIIFNRYALGWVESYTGKRTVVRERTREDYRRQLVTHVLPVFEGKKLAEITPGSIDSLVARMITGTPERRGLSPTTVRRVLVPLRGVFRAAVRNRLIAFDPMSGVEVPDLEPGGRKRRVRVLTPEQLARLIWEIPPEHRLFFDLLASTGLRWSEAVALGSKHLDIGACLIRVERAGADGTLGKTKTADSEREIRITPELCERLAMKAEEAKGREFLFCQADGRMLAYPHMRKYVLIPAAERAGLPGVRFHEFRHTAGSQLYANGASVKQIQKFLGHSNAAFTINTYIHDFGTEESPLLTAPSDLSGAVGVSGRDEHKAPERAASLTEMNGSRGDEPKPHSDNRKRRDALSRVARAPSITRATGGHPAAVHPLLQSLELRPGAATQFPGR